MLQPRISVCIFAGHDISNLMILYKIQLLPFEDILLFVINLSELKTFDNYMLAKISTYMVIRSWTYYI